jgi:hypothetical protein
MFFPARWRLTEKMLLLNRFSLLDKDCRISAQGIAHSSLPLPGGDGLRGGGVDDDGRPLPASCSFWSSGLRVPILARKQRQAKTRLLFLV